MTDVIIRGMKMPETCVQCDLKRYDQERIWTDNGTELLGAWVCKRTDEIIWNTQRGENCPLVPLPEGHGRLGDLDSILKEKYIIKPGDLLAEVTVVDACYISNAPTIIEAEGGNADG
jgi:hypothetical protein